MSTVAIQISEVSKRFILRKQRPFLLHEFVRKLYGRRNPADEFWALKEVSFTIQKGESVGIIGHNGAGKSTLLSLIIGSARPTHGHIQVEGRIGALLELGAGFHPDLTGRENIFLNASLLGLSHETIARQFQSIIDFSELGEFIDVPIRNYSSGMHVRLGFSVAIHIDPDILIMDEALAVGDANFQQKCLAKIEDMKSRGKTLLLVSHGMESIQKLCSKAVWLEHGTKVLEGPVGEVIDAYHKRMRV